MKNEKEVSMQHLGLRQRCGDSLDAVSEILVLGRCFRKLALQLAGLGLRLGKPPL
jgi:hypothetical protein